MKGITFTVDTNYAIEVLTERGYSVWTQEASDRGEQCSLAMKDYNPDSLKALLSKVKKHLSGTPCKHGVNEFCSGCQLREAYIEFTGGWAK